MSKTIECPECEGDGYLEDDEGDELECPECGGEGTIEVELEDNEEQITPEQTLTPGFMRNFWGMEL